MPSDDYGSLEKLLNSSSAPVHSSIKDDDLQIQIPNTQEVSDLEKMNRFKALYTRLERGPVGSFQQESTLDFTDNPMSAMEDAQNTYETMMEIRKQLDQAYKEIKRMQ